MLRKKSNYGEIFIIYRKIYINGKRGLEVCMRKSLIMWCRENNEKYLLDEWDVEVNGEMNEKLL